MILMPAQIGAELQRRDAWAGTLGSGVIIPAAVGAGTLGSGVLIVGFS